MKKPGVVLAGLLLTPAGLWARPVDLSPPIHRFESVSPEGYLLIWREIASINFGNGLEIPLRIGFFSKEGVVSPYLGKVMNELTVSFQVPKDQHAIGEPVVIVCELINRSPSEVPVELGWGGIANFTFRSPAKDTTIHRRSPVLPAFTVEDENKVIKGRSTLKHRLILDEWISFTKAGSYDVEWAFKRGGVTLSGWFEVRVSQTDAEILRARVRTLVDQMLKAYLGAIEPPRQWARELPSELEPPSVDLEEFFFLDRALSFVHSPEAIAELKRGAKSCPHGNYEVVKAFRRIGGEQALRALEELSMSDIEPLRVLAAAELELMKLGSIDDLQYFD